MGIEAAGTLAGMLAGMLAVTLLLGYTRSHRRMACTVASWPECGAAGDGG
ncbi:MAG TPA: hypothetical protein VGS80_01660 [Ktedonobacterales bacterium]|nr:hypothetical protein [Ktedonobacterales bacterium]